MLRAAPPRLVLFNAHGWQADLAHAQTVYVASANEAALRAHLRRLVHSPAATTLPAESAARALLEALYGEAAMVLALDATPAAAQALAATLHLLVAGLAWDPAPALAAVAPAAEAPETLAVAAAVYATVLAAAAGLRDPHALAALGCAAVVAAPTGEAAAMLRRLELRARAHGALERRTLAIARAFAELTAARDDALPLGHFEALRTLAEHPERFDPRLLRTFVRALDAEARASGATNRRVA